MQNQIELGEFLTGINIVTAGLARIIAWMLFGIVHLALAVLALVLLWWFQVSPDKVQLAISDLFHSKLATRASGTLAIFGITVSAAFYAYIKAWMYLMRKFVISFIFAPKRT